MRAEHFVVTVVAQCQLWDEEREAEILETLAHLRPACRQKGDTIMFRFCLRALDEGSACSFIKRRLRVHAAVREWRSFHVRRCAATPLHRRG
jgi:hypothetical protein